MGYSGRIFAAGVKNAVDYISKAETVPALQLYPTLSLIAMTKSRKVMHSRAIFDSRRALYVPIRKELHCCTVGQGVCTIIRNRDTLERTSS